MLGGFSPFELIKDSMYLLYRIYIHLAIIGCGLNSIGLCVLGFYPEIGVVYPLGGTVSMCSCSSKSLFPTTNVSVSFRSVVSGLEPTLLAPTLLYGGVQ